MNRVVRITELQVARSRDYLACFMGASLALSASSLALEAFGDVERFLAYIRGHRLILS